MLFSYISFSPLSSVFSGGCKRSHLFSFFFLIKLNYYNENPPCIVLWHFELARQTLLDCVDGKFPKMHFMLDCITSFYNWKATTKNSLSLSVDYALIFFFSSCISFPPSLSVSASAPVSFLFPLTVIWTSVGVSRVVANITSVKHVFHFRCGTPGTGH